MTTPGNKNADLNPVVGIPNDRGQPTFSGRGDFVDPSAGSLGGYRSVPAFLDDQQARPNNYRSAIVVPGAAGVVLPFAGKAVTIQRSFPNNTGYTGGALFEIFFSDMPEPIRYDTRDDFGSTGGLIDSISLISSNPLITANLSGGASDVSLNYSITNRRTLHISPFTFNKIRIVNLSYLQFANAELQVIAWQNPVGVGLV